MDNHLDTDQYPVRDNGYGSPSNKKSKIDDQVDSAAQRAAQQRRMVSHWERDDLEDKYLRMYEENIVLKKHARKQEEKIKRMATKLLRLVSDKKKTEHDHGVKKVRDVETEEMLEELHGKIRELEKKNNQLHEKLMVSKQQLMSQGTRKTAYPHVQSRINTGIPKPPPDPRIARNLRVTGPPTNRSAHAQGQPRYGHSLLEESRAENRHLEGVIDQANEQINIYEQDIEMLKEQMRIRESEFEEDLLKIKQQMSHGQRTTIQENIDVIRLQREVKEKSTKLSQLQAQFSNLEDKLRTVRNNNEQVLHEMEHLNHQLKEEQNRRLAVENEVKKGSASQRTLIEHQEHISDLERECEILKEANEKLVSSAFDMEREREWRQRENALKVQIAQLEATLRADVGEKGNIIDKLSGERETHETLQEDHRELKIKYFQLKQEHDELRDKMQFFTKESAVDFQEIEEALMIVKSRKERDNQDLDFLGKVEEEQTKDYEKLVRQMRAEHADTINELEKTRNMLIVQHKINKDYQMEVDAVSKKMEENKLEDDTRLQEYAQLLDIRAARIRKLEAQLRDVAYGTRQYRLNADDEELSDTDEIDETLHLDRGQNLFEVHVKRVTLTPEALRSMGDDDPNVFCTWEFYEYEIQSTPVLRGARPEFEFTSQYLVKIDDFFLHYLQKDSCTLELHQSFGTDFRTVAACQLKMRELLDRSRGRLHGCVQLTGVEYSEAGAGVNFGSLEYWVRLRVPMEQAMRLYKERSKALGYIGTNVRTAEQALTALDEQAAQRPADNINQLFIKIIRCSGLRARRDDMQPSPFCVYKFFDYNDHDTTIVTDSNTPQFNDHKTFPVSMTADLDKYLKSQPLEVYVFDDTDPDETVYLGFAKAPLIPLAHDKPVKGTFELHNKDGQVNGSIELSLKWQHPYLPPKSSTKTPAQLSAMVPAEPAEPIPLLPGEEQAMQQGALPPGAPTTPKGRPPLPRVGPVAASTPLNHHRPTPTVQFTTPDEELIGRPPSQRADEETVTAMPTRDSGEPEGSIVSEGSHVTGESVEVSSASEVSTSREGEDEAPPDRVKAVAAPSLGMAAERESDSETLTPITPQPVAGPQAGTDEEVKQRRRADDAHKTPEQLYEEELGGGKPHEDAGDTMFEENRYSDDDSIVEEEARAEESNCETEDSEGLVVASSPTPRPMSALSITNPQDLVIVMINQLSLTRGCSILNNDAIKMLFIEYCFLGVDRAETETPYALPKPAVDKAISFNFTKAFHVDFEENIDARRHLASMLLPEDPEEGRIRFNIVNEPEDPDGDCEDVGFALVSIPDILKNGRDLEDEDVPIYDVAEPETVVGLLNVTVHGLNVLRIIDQEMQQTGDSLTLTQT